MKLARLSLLFMLVISSRMAFAQRQGPISLYPNGVPNSKPAPADYIENINETNWMTKVTVPTLTPYFPEQGKRNGTAVVICPGGAYAGLAWKHEGIDVAKEFAKNGVTAFVLKYRLPSDLIMKDKSIGPLQDAQRAIQLVRQNAVGWNLDANKIGIMGFSAGGHLASTEGTHFDKVVIDNPSNISVRPDFMLLIYPVITFGEFTHSGSKENLTGKTPSPETVDLYSNEKQVNANTPPTFIIHAQDDDVVPIQNALMMYDALVKAKVKAEMHVFQSGGHGFGMINPRSKGLWFNWCLYWMDANGLMKKQ